jgi:hypothetical protein
MDDYTNHLYPKETIYGVLSHARTHRLAQKREKEIYEKPPIHYNTNPSNSHVYSQYSESQTNHA